MSDYCPECGGLHPTSTAGCPYKKNNYYLPEDVNISSIIENPIEKKLDKIIKLLEKIELLLQTKQ